MLKKMMSEGSLSRKVGKAIPYIFLPYVVFLSSRDGAKQGAIPFSSLFIMITVTQSLGTVSDAFIYQNKKMTLLDCFPVKKRMKKYDNALGLIQDIFQYAAFLSYYASLMLCVISGYRAVAIVEEKPNPFVVAIFLRNIATLDLPGVISAVLFERRTFSTQEKKEQGALKG